MNERIKEFDEQSGAWEYYEINEGVEGDEKPLEKFAELIVRETFQVLAQAGIEFGDGMEDAVYKYFGVEE